MSNATYLDGADGPATRPLCLRPPEAAKALAISPRTLWSLTAPRGPIPCVRVGSGKRQAVLYPVALLEAYLREHADGDLAVGENQR